MKKHFGIIYAPGSKDDAAMNQYVAEKVVQRFSNDDSHRKGVRVFTEHPTSSLHSIASAVHRLVKNCECEWLYVLGEQCVTPLRHIVSSGIHPGINRIFFANYPAESVSSSPLEVLDTGQGPKETSSHLYCTNFFETRLARVLGVAVARLSDRLSFGEQQQARVALIGGPNVPVTQKWLRGFQDGYGAASPRSELMTYTLGTGYSKFDDPHAGYELASYILRTYRVRFIVEVCGASAKGVVAAIGDQNNKERRAYYVPFDYFDWSRPGKLRGQVPLTLVRNFESVIETIIQNENVDQLRDALSHVALGTLEFSESSPVKLEPEDIEILQKEGPVIGFKEIRC